MTDWHETLLCEFLWLTGCTFDIHSFVWQISSPEFGMKTALISTDIYEPAIKFNIKSKQAEEITPLYEVLHCSVF